MAQLIVRNLDDNLVLHLKKRAAAKGRSAEAEHRDILKQALRPLVPDFWDRAARLRLELASKDLGDSTAIIREERDRRAGLVD